ncbi:TetR/AcrR family transcriptional regulator [Bacillus salitolerans]|uniref:TetR/AcrR family transcriptional regulator n=1 Tax=Bacillus salitolerans TaxID=1437434 RepID=A0ABW4LV83_9BACI
MPPKKKFSEDQIIDAAFEIAKSEGIDSITIRKVAEKLGSSIAPIYVNFNDVAELKQRVVRKTFEVSKDLLKEQNTGSPFQDIGLASIRFARDYSILFRDLVMKQNSYMNHYDSDMGDALIEKMKCDPLLEGFDIHELKTILLKMKIFHVGLSVMVANGILPESFDEETVKQTLESVAKDVMAAARLRKNGEL